ncbi:hypothetical protein SAMN04489712_1305 [Thermomonospora echinospora]|uniref:Transposase DDE domain-containing protein n=1 Tax=Thermomonospora echinospora TaxID=1992 RepID=A0A1H6E251_9ACTN|nr:hypothetical protein SAMN04489712_1305 [Thermomonospora echinospora]
MTSLTCANGWEGNVFGPGSPARASSPTTAWDDTAGSSSAPCAWLTGYRRLTLRYERDLRNYLAFLGLAAALVCYKRLIKLTT